MKSLFISYNGALEPLVQSQGIPYLKGLSGRGAECILLTFEKTYKNNFKEKIAELRKELKSYGIKWYCLKYHKSPSLPATLFDIFMGIAVGLYIVIVEKIDIIHARATVPALMGHVLAGITGKKFIFDERGLMAEEYADGGMWKKEGFLYRLTLYCQKRLLTRADHVVVLTENIKDFLLNSDYLGAAKRNNKPDISVIPCCVDLERFSETDPSVEQLKKRHGLCGKFIFLYTGSLGTWYMIDEMLDFFLFARSLIKNAHFLFLTHNINKNILIGSCIRAGVPFENISINSVAFKDMPHYIKLADVGIFFIKPVFSKRSSCPTKFSEYLACGLPVFINSGIGDTDKIVERYKIGAVINNFNKESYACGLNELSGLMQEGGQLAQRCRWVARDLFSLEMGVSRYLDIYSRISAVA